MSTTSQTRLCNMSLGLFIRLRSELAYLLLTTRQCSPVFVIEGPCVLPVSGSTAVVKGCTCRTLRKVKALRCRGLI